MDSMDTMDGMLDLGQIELAQYNPEPYVLSWPLGEEVDGDGEASALALMKREEGVLLAVPCSFFPEAIVEAANAGASGILGPSAIFQVPAVLSEGGNTTRTGTDMEVLVIDCSASVVAHLRRFHAQEEIVYGFDEDAAFNFPDVLDLMLKVQEWISAQQGGDLAGFYTPEEVADAETPSPARTAPPRRAPQRKGTPSGDGSKQKRPTTASLAAEMKTLTTYLPQISDQLLQLSQRQDLVESQLAVQGSSASTLASRPLSAAMTPPSRMPLGNLAKAVGAPPRTMNQPSLGLLAEAERFAVPEEIKGLEAEKQGVADLSSQSVDSSLALAVLEQSRALTSLVAQIAASQSDPMTDLSGSSSTSTRGAAGRAKLQAELAAHRGTFFTAVMHQMARRMAPTSSVDQGPAALLTRGISGVKYLERFGGFCRQRDLGQLMYQIMTAFDYLMEDNIPAAKDTVALLAVTVEQTCMDGGRTDLASLLCLQEDPPASIFQNRQPATTSRSRSFAPLADQRWVTCALAFLKEMEVIQSKRLELTGGKNTPFEPGADNPKPKGKPAAKKKGRGKGAPQEDAENAG